MLRSPVVGLAIGLCLCSSLAIAQPTVITVGDGQVDGSRIQPYEYTWIQCSKQGDSWIDGGTLTERVKAIELTDKNLLQIQQETARPNGAYSRSATYLDHASLSPRRIELHVYDAKNQQRAAMSYELGTDGYTGTKTKGDDRELLSGSVTSNFYHGMHLGLPLATLDLPGDLPAEMPASMISFDATYRVIATDAGSETMQIGDKYVEAQMIDVEWHHLDLGDVYPPGPDASGGRYWVVPDPPEGVPYVPRYKTDSYAIEFVADTCADAVAPIEPN